MSEHRLLTRSHAHCASHVARSEDVKCSSTCFWYCLAPPVESALSALPWVFLQNVLVERRPGSWWAGLEAMVR